MTATPASAPTAGAADWRDGDYYGSAVNRCARVRGLAHGGQTLLSEATAGLTRDDLPAGARLVDLGTHPLKGLSRPETVYQVWLPDLPNDFPPLQSAAEFAGNLPTAPAAIIGRQREVADLTHLLTDEDILTPVLPHPHDAHHSTRALIQAALDRGGIDNVTVVSCTVSEAREQANSH